MKLLNLHLEKKLESPSGTFEWFVHFKGGRMSIECDSGPTHSSSPPPQH
jgi:hypothetical protein